MPAPDSVAIHEYGIDPAVLNSWERFSRFFIDCCGYGQGRVISALPDRRTWINEVLDACEENGMKPVHRSSVAERLRFCEDRFFERADIFAAQSWLETAITAHSQEALRLIISETSNGNPIVETPEDLGSEGGPWKATSEGSLERSAREIQRLCRLLLMQAKKIHIVDPYIDLSGPVLRAIVPLAWEGRWPSSLQIHTSRRGQSNDHIIDSLEELVPLGESLKVYLWNTESLGSGLDRPHDRFLLTELGGVALGWGFSHMPGSLTQASLMSSESACTWQVRFRNNSNQYELECDPIEVWGTAE